MPTVARTLISARSEPLDQKIGKTASNIEKGRLAGCFIMNNSSLNQVTSTIEFMEISEVFESMTRPPSEDVTIDVAIGSLSMFEACDDIVQCLLHAIVFDLFEIGRPSFQPFSKI